MLKKVIHILNHYIFSLTNILNVKITILIILQVFANNFARYFMQIDNVICWIKFQLLKTFLLWMWQENVDISSKFWIYMPILHNRDYG